MHYSIIALALLIAWLSPTASGWAQNPAPACKGLDVGSCGAWRRDGNTWRPHAAIRLWWRDGAVVRIRDYIHVDYLLTHWASNE